MRAVRSQGVWDYLWETSQMAYNITQLTSFFTNANAGTAPTAAQTLTLQALVNQNAAGTLTDAQAFSSTVDLASDASTAVSVGTYQFFLGFAPSQAGLASLNAAYVGTGAQASLNGENRFIAQSVSLALSNETAKTSFTTSYGALSVADATKAAYNIIIGNAAAAAAGVNVDNAVAYLTSAASITYYTNFVKANVPGLTTAADIDLAVKAAIIGEIMYIATTYNNGAGIGSYATATTNLVKDLADDGVLSANNSAGIDLFANYGAPSTGASVALTTGSDTLTGGSGADFFTGVADGVAANTTFTNLDVINGGGGYDTLTLTNASGTVGLAAGATVSSVEHLSIRSAQNAVTADVSSWTGLQKVSVEQVGTAAATSITTKGNATSAVFTSGTTIAVTDSATTDTLASVSLNGNTGAATLTSDALTSVSVKGTSTDVTVTAAAGTRALGVTLNNVTGGVYTDAEATTLNVTTTGAKSSGVTLTAVKATAVTVAADEALTVADVNLTAAKTLTVTGDSLVTITATTDVAALTSVDSSASTGGVSIGAALATGVAFTGGAGKDTITIGATTKTITTGAGDDSVTINAAALGTNGSVNAGAGTDTLGLTAANAITASATTTFAGTVKGFEVLSVGAAGAAGTIDLANLNTSTNNTINKVISAGGTFALTISGLASAGTLELTAGNTGGTVVNVTDAATNTADVLNVALKGAGAVTAGTVTAASVETVNILSDDTASTPTGITHTMTLAASAVTSIVVTGDAGLTLTHTGTALTSLDASGVTKGGVSLTTAALTSASTFTGSAGADTFNAAASTKAVTINAGAGNDVITGSSTIASTLNGGDGNDTITGGAEADTITGGAGNDTITSGAGLDTVDVGAGNDTFVLTANANGNVYATITGMGAGDKIDFLAGGAAATFVTAKLSLANTAAFADYLQAAAAGGADRVTWFQYGGDTYVVQDVTAGATFTNGADQVVKLVGLIDLSTATIDGAATNVLTLA
jgi:RsaA N-terminal domain/RTX calcium-binding nonapeptide repeat (4 copies)